MTSESVDAGPEPGQDVSEASERPSPRGWPRVVRWALTVLALLVVAGSIVVIALDASQQTTDPIGDAMIVGVSCTREDATSVSDPMQAVITVGDDGVSDVTLTGTITANRNGCRLQVFGPFSDLGNQTLRVNGAPRASDANQPTTVDLPVGTAVPITVTYRTELAVEPAGLGRRTFGVTINWGLPPASNETRIPGSLAEVDGIVLDVKLPSAWFTERTSTTASVLPLRDHEAHFGIDGDRSRIGFQFGVEEPAVRRLVTVAPIALAAAVGLLIGLALSVRRRPRASAGETAPGTIASDPPSPPPPGFVPESSPGSTPEASPGSASQVSPGSASKASAGSASKASAGSASEPRPGLASTPRSDDDPTA